MRILKVEIESEAAVCVEDGKFVIRPGFVDLKEMIDAEEEALIDAITAIILSEE